MNQISQKNIAADNIPSGSMSSSVVSLLAKQSTLALIMILAVIVRAVSSLYQGNIVESLPGVHDQISYDLLARRLVAGHGFTFAEAHWPVTPAGEPTAHWSYLYTIYLAVVYAVTGAQPVIARLFQAALAGIVHCWLAWRIGRRIGGPTTGIISALLSAIYIYFFYYAGTLMTETFYILGILWTIDCALRLAASQRQDEEGSTLSKVPWRLWLELGLAIGITALFRQVFLLFIPFLYLWLWWNLRHTPQPSQYKPRWAGVSAAFAGTVVSTLIVLLLILPWTVRNYRAFDTFVLLNTNSGYAFFWGNHPIYGTNFVGILPSGGPTYQELIPTELRHLNEAELDRALLKEGLGFVFDDPVRYLQLSLSRTREYFKFWPSANSSQISNISRVGSFGLLLPFMLYGLWLGGKLIWRPADPHQRSAIILLLLFAIVYTSIHLLTWALIRYRLPVDVVLVIFAALGLTKLLSRTHRLQKQSPLFPS
jgi:hypothetical protein